MGKDLSGKELGKGISQRKDGKYIGRFTDSTGKRNVKYFTSVVECNQWISNSKGKENQVYILHNNMTVDEWFMYWIANIKGKTVRYNTVKNYTDRYNCSIKKWIGTMPVCEVKPVHCQIVLNNMETENYAGSTMEQTRITMYNMFDSAEENEVILSNPVKRSVKCPKKTDKKNKVLTVLEQRLFLEAAKGTSNYYQYQLLLQTGLRAGELIGLKWDDIDFNKREISIRRSVGYDYTSKEYVVGEPKSASGYRVIPMTQLAYNILNEKNRQIKNNQNSGKVSEFTDYIFVNKNGVPTKNTSYDAHIRKIADKAGIEHFSMHTLRHTFATRCIEAGMKPKTLQKILGHSNINITMNLYVHVTDDEKKSEMKKLEALNINV